jgi:hypothetical protein
MRPLPRCRLGISKSSRHADIASLDMCSVGEVIGIGCSKFDSNFELAFNREPKCQNESFICVEKYRSTSHP